MAAQYCLVPLPSLVHANGCFCTLSTKSTKWKDKQCLDFIIKIFHGPSLGSQESQDPQTKLSESADYSLRLLANSTTDCINHKMNE